MQKIIEFYLNDELVSSAVNPATTILDFLRVDKRLTGTKEGCREGDCGACTVLVGTLKDNAVTYKSVNSCLLPIGDVHGKHVVSVEGLNLANSLNLIQLNMADEGGTQCGFCTPGFIISMTGYFINTTSPDIDSAIASLDGNICRCTGYAGIKRALENAIVAYNSSSAKQPIEKLIDLKMIPSYFASIPQQLALIEKEKQESTGKVVVGGGTDLFVQRWEALLESEVELVSEDESLHGITLEKGVIVIGGAVTHSEIAQSEIIKNVYPQINEALVLFGSLPIRNRGTVAGNIVNASPIADIVNILLALNATVTLCGASKKRNVLLKEFYKGYKTLDKSADEIVESVSIPVPKKKHFFSYEKVSRRTHLDIASVNTSFYVEIVADTVVSANISAGGVAPVPFYLSKTVDYLIGKSISPVVMKEAVAIAKNEVAPISDARGSVEYKKLLLGQLLKVHFLKLFPEKITAEAVV